MIELPIQEIKFKKSQLLDELETALNEKLITTPYKDPTKELIRFLQEQRVMSQKTNMNMIFFGMTNSGKTSSINSFINFLLDSKKRIEWLPTLSKENTYYITMIESSSNDKFEIEVEDTINEFNPSSSDSVELEGNILRFENNDKGHKEFRKFLLKLDEESVKKIEESHKNTNTNSNSDERTILETLRIRIPSLPKDLTIIDSPGLSTSHFKNISIGLLTKQSCMNIFIYVKNVNQDVLFNSNFQDVLEFIVRHFKNPIFYVLITKYDELLENFKKWKRMDEDNDDDEDEKKGKREYNHAISFTANFLQKLNKYIDQGLHLRSILPINNLNLIESKNILYRIKDDAYSIKKKFGDADHERNLKLNINLKIEEYNTMISQQNTIFNSEELSEIQREIEKTKERFRELMETFSKRISNMESFKDAYPDMFTKIEENVKENRKTIKNKHIFSLVRNNYMKRQADETWKLFEHFANEQVIKSRMRCLDQLMDESLNPIIRAKIVKILKDFTSDSFFETNLTGSFVFTALLGVSMGFGATLITPFVIQRLVASGFLAAGEASAAALGLTLAPFVGIIVGCVVGAVGLGITFSEIIGMWTFDKADEELILKLFEHFMKEKHKILGQANINFSECLEKFFKLLKNRKEKDDFVIKLKEILLKFHPKIQSEKITTNVKKEMKIFIIFLSESSLKLFFKEVLAKKEVEESEMN